MAAFGRLPGWVVTAVTLGIAVVTAAVPGGAVGDAIGWVALAVFVAYCVARPSGGLTVFLYSCLPGVASVVGVLVFDVESWVAVAPAMAVALWLIADLDRAPRQDPAALSPP